jgi:hypothetical protein
MDRIRAPLLRAEGDGKCRYEILPHNGGICSDLIKLGCRIWGLELVTTYGMVQHGLAQNNWLLGVGYCYGLHRTARGAGVGNSNLQILESFAWGWDGKVLKF